MTAANFDADTAASPVALAMDWGGTWARAAVIDRQGRLLWQDRVANAAGVHTEQRSREVHLHCDRKVAKELFNILTNIIG